MSLLRVRLVEKLLDGRGILPAEGPEGDALRTFGADDSASRSTPISQTSQAFA
jgi:hypothetical protein